MRLEDKISVLNRVGKTLEKRLQVLGIQTIRDLLFHFPVRHEDFSRIVLISEIKDGENITVRGQVELIANRRGRKWGKIVTEAVIADDSDQLRVVWFGQPFIAKNLQPGDMAHFSGKVTSDIFGRQMKNPVYEKIGNSSSIHTARLVPIYPLTYGLTQKQLRFLLQQALPMVEKIPEWLPEEIKKKAGVIGLSEAVRAMHFPSGNADLEKAEKRLKFDELFAIQLRAEYARRKIAREKAPILSFKEGEIKKFVSALPFTLTKTQKIAAWEILRDLEKASPMNRLLTGDVGSGKTVVAALAAYDCVLNGYQAVFMAPTEVLAFQHFFSLKKMLANAGVPLALLTSGRAEFVSGSDSETGKSKVLKKIKEDFRGIAVGTQALLSDEKLFDRLGLLIVDEQHRFGVNQRHFLRKKTGADFSPHFLSMTATPIPRTLAIAIYGDLALSIISELPPGRKPIITKTVSEENRQPAYDFIRKQVKSGRQGFVICPLVKAKEDEEAPTQSFTAAEERKSVEKEFEKLSKNIFPDLRLKYLHGKMKGEEKEKILSEMKKGDIDILVSTSVVEVGVDIPNAAFMLIEGAESFGLAQLHQFRGRIGRSVYQSYCLLFAGTAGEAAAKRLAFFSANLDGFALAEYDLQFRGPGEVYGVAQSGISELKMAKLTDGELIKAARHLAVETDFEKFPSLLEKIKTEAEEIHLE